jgi:hypothetical protein
VVGAGFNVGGFDNGKKKVNKLFLRYEKCFYLIKVLHIMLVIPLIFCYYDLHILFDIVKQS